MCIYVYSFAVSLLYWCDWTSDQRIFKNLGIEKATMSAAIAAAAITEDIISPSPDIWKVRFLLYHEVSESDVHFYLLSRSKMLKEMD